MTPAPVITNGKIAHISDTVRLYRDPDNPDCLLDQGQWDARLAMAAQLEARAATTPAWLKEMRDILIQGRAEGHSHLNIPGEYALWLLDHVQPVFKLTGSEPLDSDQREEMAKLTTLTPYDPISRLEQAMAEDPYPQPKGKRVRRYEDMSPKGHLTLYRQEDGDVVIEVARPDEDSGALSLTAVEFCTPMIGGGQSSHTHRALVALMVAMEKDEEERKQVRR